MMIMVRGIFLDEGWDNFGCGREDSLRIWWNVMLFEKGLPKTWRFIKPSKINLPTESNHVSFENVKTTLLDKRTFPVKQNWKMKEMSFMFLFKELYFPEIYRQFSTIQQNIIFIESIARCGKGNTRQNIQENIQQNIKQNILQHLLQYSYSRWKICMFWWNSQ